VQLQLDSEKSPLNKRSLLPLKHERSAVVRQRSTKIELKAERRGEAASASAAFQRAQTRSIGSGP